MDLLDRSSVDTVLFEHLGSALCGVDIESEVSVFLRDLADLDLIRITDGDEYAAVLCHLIARGDKSLVKRLFKRARDTEHLAR